MRYLVIVSDGGLIRDVEPFHQPGDAKARASAIAGGLDPEMDDVIVWDLEDGCRIFQPLAQERES